MAVLLLCPALCAQWFSLIRVWVPFYPQTHTLIWKIAPSLVLGGRPHLFTQPFCLALLTRPRLCTIRTQFGTPDSERLPPPLPALLPLSGTPLLPGLVDVWSCLHTANFRLPRSCLPAAPLSVPPLCLFVPPAPPVTDARSQQLSPHLTALPTLQAPCCSAGAPSGLHCNPTLCHKEVLYQGSRKQQGGGEGWGTRKAQRGCLGMGGLAWEGRHTRLEGMNVGGYSTSASLGCGLHGARCCMLLLPCRQLSRKQELPGYRVSCRGKERGFWSIIERGVFWKVFSS